MLESNARVLRHKVGLHNLAKEPGNLSRACKLMSMSQDTLYRNKEAVDNGGVDARLDKLCDS